MASEAKTFKQYAKEAKNRMKTGFWKKYHENLEKEVARAEQAGIAPSKILAYWMEKADKTIINCNEEEECFYAKVKKMSTNLQAFFQISPKKQRFFPRKYSKKVALRAKEN